MAYQMLSSYCDCSRWLSSWPLTSDLPYWLKHGSLPLNEIQRSIQNQTWWIENLSWAQISFVQKAHRIFSIFNISLNHQSHVLLIHTVYRFQGKFDRVRGITLPYNFYRLYKTSQTKANQNVFQTEMHEMTAILNC